MTHYVVSNELYHHGILGQKWGVRRFQNPDGTLTEAGKARYLDSNSQDRLTDAGRAAKKKAYEKMNGKGSYDKRISKESVAEAVNYYSSEVSTKDLSKMAAINMRAGLEKLKEHQAIIDSGELFTKRYFDTEIAAILDTGYALGATQVIKERARLYEQAKNNDTYSLDFLEMTPDNWGSKPEKEKLADYKQWLDDPAKWRDGR